MANQITPVSTEQDVEAPPPPPLPPQSHDQQTKAKDLFAAAIDQTSSKEEKDQEAFPPPIVADEEEADGPSQPPQHLRRRRCLLLCGGCCGATVLVLGLVLLILSFTVLKVKDPTLTMNNMYVDRLAPGLGTWEHPLSLNATFTFDVSLRNPNVASFAYEDSATEFYYLGQMVGVAYAPDGEVGARRTARMNATLDVMLDRVLQTNATASVVDGDALNLTSFTDIRGRVDVAGIYKRDIEVMLNCSMTLDLNSETQSQVLGNQHCLANVR
ncbi:uncharacterized protein M6B38_151410 [Iris pallida]|uniref:Late embryogenesis abundant protein LEA-2 subgroup domain-containing protein n=1 Tax=Iris pallida TaxID=29817 RepID=A0AAX6F6R1_IRIPA|nr:uncharacterized protein M6B38_151410 [Iris pallida]